MAWRIGEANKWSRGGIVDIQRQVIIQLIFLSNNELID
jgi:hypothetical protein